MRLKCRKKKKEGTKEETDLLSEVRYSDAYSSMQGSADSVFLLGSTSAHPGITNILKVLYTYAAGGGVMALLQMAGMMSEERNKRFLSVSRAH